MVELYAGLGGWTEGFLSEGYRAIGFDIERHVYGDQKYPAQLVLQDVLTLHGSQFRDAAVIVASPPCQAYSYMAMPWVRAKKMASEIRSDQVKLWGLTALFDACFRIQREASEAAGHHIPLIVENVRGAQPWVGRAAWHYGSFYLWGDIPALMPAARHFKTICHANKRDGHNHTRHLTSQRESDGVKLSGLANGTFPGGGIAQGYIDKEGTKNGKDWFGSGENCSLQRRAASKSASRKAASAQIAKIPFPLASYIARCFKPEILEAIV